MRWELKTPCTSSQNISGIFLQKIIKIRLYVWRSHGVFLIHGVCRLGYIYISNNHWKCLGGRGHLGSRDNMAAISSVFRVRVWTTNWSACGLKSAEICGFVDISISDADDLKSKGLMIWNPFLICEFDLNFWILKILDFDFKTNQCWGKPFKVWSQNSNQNTTTKEFENPKNHKSSDNINIIVSLSWFQQCMVVKAAEQKCQLVATTKSQPIATETVVYSAYNIRKINVKSVICNEKLYLTINC